MASTDALTMRGHSAAWAFPLTVTGNTITGVGTGIQFKAIADPEGLFAAAGAAAAGAAGDTIATVVADGVTIEVDKVTRKIEGTTGLHKAGSTGSGGSSPTDIVRWTTLLMGRTKVAELAGMRGLPYLVCIPNPDAVAASEEGFMYMIGVMSSEVSAKGAAETIGTNVVEFTGGKAYVNGFAGADDDAKNTALAAAVDFVAITPITNVTEYTVAPILPPDLVLADIPDLLSGVIVMKAAA